MLFILLAVIPFLVDTVIGLLGGARLSTSNPRYIIAFSSGVVISAAFFELLPEANIEANSIFVALGFFLFYFVEKVTMLHACGEEECEVHTLGPLSVLGMALDNIVDGMGIAVATLLNPWLGITITVAVVSHEIPQALTSLYIMGGLSKPYRETFLMLFVAGIMYPLGASLSIFIPTNYYSIVVALVAGVFLYVGAGDLLLEAHRSFNWKVVVAVLIGATLGLLISVLGA
jgi:zinc transporter ZupT